MYHKEIYIKQYYFNRPNLWKQQPPGFNKALFVFPTGKKRQFLYRGRCNYSCDTKYVKTWNGRPAVWGMRWRDSNEHHFRNKLAQREFLFAMPFQISSGRKPVISSFLSSSKSTLRQHL